MDRQKTRERKPQVSNDETWGSRSRLQLQNLAHPGARGDFPRGSSALLEPFVEGAKVHGVLHRSISRQNANCEVLIDALRPTGLPDGAQPERDRFIEAGGGDFRAVFDTFAIPDGHAAGAGRHSGSLALSPYIR